MRTNHPVVVLRLEVLPDPQDPEGTMRLRRLLKYAGRALGLRCRSAAPEVPAIKPAAQPDPAQAEELLGPQQPRKRTRKKRRETPPTQPPTEGAGP